MFKKLFSVFATNNKVVTQLQPLNTEISEHLSTLEYKFEFKNSAFCDQKLKKTVLARHIQMVGHIPNCNVYDVNEKLSRLFIY